MRMREGRHWTKVFRQKAWERMCDEARRRSFLDHFAFAIAGILSLMTERKAG